MGYAGWLTAVAIIMANVIIFIHHPNSRLFTYDVNATRSIVKITRIQLFIAISIDGCFWNNQHHPQIPGNTYYFIIWASNNLEWIYGKTQCTMHNVSVLLFSYINDSKFIAPEINQIEPIIPTHYTPQQDEVTY